MTDKPVIPRPPKVPPRRHEQPLLRQISPAELAEALKAHRRWLKNGPAGGSRLDLNSCDLTGVALQGALLSRAGLNRAVLSGALLSNAKLERAELTGAELEGALLDRADLKGARVSGANLRRADLTATHAPYMDAEFADFSGARLDHVDLTGADLSGAIMAGANLTGARLSRANLRGADLRGARLTGADLREAKLGAADLRGADLTGADLRRAYMRLARLDDANLAGADLSGAAWLSQAQLDRARVDEAARLPEVRLRGRSGLPTISDGAAALGAISQRRIPLNSDIRALRSPARLFSSIALRYFPARSARLPAIRAIWSTISMSSIF